jgi:hypothetical protein
MELEKRSRALQGCNLMRVIRSFRCFDDFDRSKTNGCFGNIDDDFLGVVTDRLLRRRFCFAVVLPELIGSDQGRPRGRRDDSRFSLVAVDSTQFASPNGLPRCAEVRMAFMPRLLMSPFPFPHIKVFHRAIEACFEGISYNDLLQFCSRCHNQLPQVLQTAPPP